MTVQPGPWGAAPQAPQGQPQWGAPPQGYQQPAQQGWGQQPQYAQPPVALGSDEDFWGEVSANGPSAPSYKWGGVSGPATREHIGETVEGEVVAQVLTQASSGTGQNRQPKFDKNGRPVKQLIVTLRTNLRNWQKVPVDNNTGQLLVPKGPNGQPLPPEADEGLRRIYIKYDMSAAVKNAMDAVGATRLEEGGTLGVRLRDFKPTNEANPLPLYDAFYRPPAKPNASSEFFGQQPAAPAAPAEQPTAQSHPYAQQALQQAQGAAGGVTQNPFAAQAPQQSPADQGPWGPPPQDQPPY